MNAIKRWLQAKLFPETLPLQAELDRIRVEMRHMRKDKEASDARIRELLAQQDMVNRANANLRNALNRKIAGK